MLNEWFKKRLKKNYRKNVYSRNSPYSSPTILLYRRVASLFSLARTTSNEFVSCTLRETQGCCFQVSCHYFVKQDFRPTRTYTFSRSRARSIIASELSSKKTSFRADAFSANFSRAVSCRCYISVERINRTHRCFSFDFPTRAITILAKISRGVFWRCLLLHLNCVFASSLTNLLPFSSLA